MLHEQQILAHTPTHPTHRLQHALFSPILHLCLQQIYCCTTLDRSRQARSDMCDAKKTNLSHPKILLASGTGKKNMFYTEQKKPLFDQMSGAWAKAMT